MESVNVDSDRDAVLAAIEDQIKETDGDGLAKQKQEDIRSLVNNNLSIFCAAFSAGPPAGIKPFKMDLAPHGRPVRVKLRNYSQEQRQFLKKFVADLLLCGMVHANPILSVRDPLLHFALRCKFESDTYDNASTRPTRSHVYDER